MRRVVVVGASLAGARAADALRRFGFSGELHLVGAENHLPYERPPLSKQILAGAWELDRAGIDLPESFDATWHLGRSATKLDTVERVLELDDATVLPYDGMVIATGASPRSLPGTETIEGIHLLRTIDDALALREAAGVSATGSGEGSPRPPTGTGKRVVVVGGGFIGCEVAATLGAAGAEVTVVDPLDHLMGRALGDDFAGFFEELHASKGVTLRLGTGVEGLVAPAGHVEACMLSDGTRIACDLVVVGIGVRPATDWLAGSGIALDPSDGGIVCDEFCGVTSASGAPLEGVVAAGDVARWDHRLFGRPLRVEHWENALAMAEAAARHLLGGADAYDDVPFFWSDQWSTKIQFVGLRSSGDEVQVVEGSPGEGRFVALYSREGRLTGALGVGRAARIVAMRNAIAEGATLEEVLP